MTKSIVSIFILFLSLTACQGDKETVVENDATQSKESIFDAKKWSSERDNKYLYREAMLEDVLYNDTIRQLDKEAIIALLGRPDRVQNNHFYYTITEKRWGLWTFHQSSMVVKFTEGDAIEWIKYHE